ncbi:hypothetical protein C0Q70_00318 [Pomacea canaliculata]|uniref:Uncharacterized protein n=1 Tax=Pomacea canaliculata TaxID=400727 RepID=A0A2T7PWF2_POMCA|nr:hypothetical protein C0Q70_00318 [Pomacea canaliculata]
MNSTVGHRDMRETRDENIVVGKVVTEIRSHCVQEQGGHVTSSDATTAVGNICPHPQQQDLWQYFLKTDDIHYLAILIHT